MTGRTELPMRYVYVIGILIGIGVVHQLDARPETRRGWLMFGVWMLITLIINLALHAFFFSLLAWWLVIVVWIMIGPLSYWRYLDLRQRARANARSKSGRKR